MFLFAIIFSLTRGLWIINFILIFFIFAVIGKISSRVRMVVLYLIIFIVAFFTISFFGIPSIIKERFFSIFTGGQLRNARFYVWLTGVKIFLSYPSGIGLGNFPVYSPHFALPQVFMIPGGLFKEGIIRGPHSDWFSLLAETGTIGVLLYLLFWYQILKVVFHTSGCSALSLTLRTYVLSIFLFSFIEDLIMSGYGTKIVLFYYLLSRSIRCDTFNVGR